MHAAGDKRREKFKKGKSAPLNVVDPKTTNLRVVASKGRPNTFLATKPNM